MYRLYLSEIFLAKHQHDELFLDLNVLPVASLYQLPTSTILLIELCPNYTKEHILPLPQQQRLLTILHLQNIQNTKLLDFLEEVADEKLLVNLLCIRHLCISGTEQL